MIFVSPKQTQAESPVTSEGLDPGKPLITVYKIRLLLKNWKRENDSKKTETI